MVFLSGVNNWEGELQRRAHPAPRLTKCTRVVRHHCHHPEPDSVLPDSDLEHAAEQLWVVGDNPSDMDDQLLLKNSLPLPTVRGALAVDDALDHPRRQWIGDHLLPMAEQTEGHLVITDSTEKKNIYQTHIQLENVSSASELFCLILFVCVCVCQCRCTDTRESVYMRRLACAHSTSTKVQFLQVSVLYHCKIGLLSKSPINVNGKK